MVRNGSTPAPRLREAVAGTLVAFPSACCSAKSVAEQTSARRLHGTARRTPASVLYIITTGASNFVRVAAEHAGDRQAATAHCGRAGSASRCRTRGRQLGEPTPARTRRVMHVIRAAPPCASEDTADHALTLPPACQLRPLRNSRPDGEGFQRRPSAENGG